MKETIHISHSNSHTNTTKLTFYNNSSFYVCSNFHLTAMRGIESLVHSCEYKFSYIFFVGFFLGLFFLAVGYPHSFHREYKVLSYIRLKSWCYAPYTTQLDRLLYRAYLLTILDFEYFFNIILDECFDRI